MDALSTSLLGELHARMALHTDKLKVGFNSPLLHTAPIEIVGSIAISKLHLYLLTKTYSISIVFILPSII